MLLCWFDHSPFFPFSKHSLSVSPNRFSFSIKTLTSVKTFHQYIVYFLVPLHSSNHRMTTGSPLLCEETPAGWSAFTCYSNSIQVSILKISFDIFSHFFFHWILGYKNTSILVETQSQERLPPKAEEFFLPMRQTIPCCTPTRFFMVLGK